jgi:choline dehydrogenase-like flavoprotein
MLNDAHSVRSGASLEADVCIIGAGPAGISLGQALVDTSSRVICLDSGGLAAEKAAQALNRGEVEGGPYVGLEVSRHRQVGGTTAIWNTPLPSGPGAKYLPLDALDFEADSARPGWPFDRATLRSHYEEAQTLCELGAFAYRADDWTREDIFAPADARVSAAIYQFGPSHVFTNGLVEKIAKAENVQILYHATGCTLRLAGRRRDVACLDAVSLSGTRFSVKARVFVVAGGAIENARLLLASRTPGFSEPGNDHGWLGRCFMEHPRDRSMVLIPNDSVFYEKARFYDLHPAADGTLIGGRIALTEEAIRTEGLVNASMSILPLPRELPDRPLSRVSQYVKRLLGRRFQPGYGWSDVRAPERHYRGFQLLINSEQLPRKENGVRLGTSTDRFGVPLARLQWRWRKEDQTELERVKSVFAEAFTAANVGQIVADRSVVADPNAHHHAGTTRMHDDAKLGVVDADCRVHGTDNVYVVGASVFPSAGFANPTLTIVALALRLAQHLKQRL